MLHPQCRQVIKLHFNLNSISECYVTFKRATLLDWVKAVNDINCSDNFAKKLYQSNFCDISPNEMLEKLKCVHFCKNFLIPRLTTESNLVRWRLWDSFLPMAAPGNFWKSNKTRMIRNWGLSGEYTWPRNFTFLFLESQKVDKILRWAYLPCKFCNIGYLFKARFDL